MNALLADMSDAPAKKNKKKVDELDRMLAGCTVQRFAGSSVPSHFSL
jgi:hypothetical protein